MSLLQEWRVLISHFQFLVESSKVPGSLKFLQRCHIGIQSFSFSNQCNSQVSTSVFCRIRVGDWFLNYFGDFFFLQKSFLAHSFVNEPLIVKRLMLVFISF